MRRKSSKDREFNNLKNTNLNKLCTWKINKNRRSINYWTDYKVLIDWFRASNITKGKIGTYDEKYWRFVQQLLKKTFQKIRYKWNVKNEVNISKKRGISTKNIQRAQTL